MKKNTFFDFRSLPENSVSLQRNTRQEQNRRAVMIPKFPNYVGTCGYIYYVYYMHACLPSESLAT